MKIGVIVFPGSNCDHDCVHAFKDVCGAEADFVWHQSTSLKGYDAVVLPGGFSYGDYLRCGAIARFSPIMDAVVEFAQNGKLVIGICNGFQVLLESGLLPGALQRNQHLKFICKDTAIRVENTDTPFTGRCQPGQLLQVPIAHGEGNYFADEATLAELKKNDQIVFRYVNNENGSLDSIAGICNVKRNVLGMMPHPERSAEAILGSTDGRIILQSMMDFIIGGSR